MKAFALQAAADDDRFEETWSHSYAAPVRGESDFCSKEGALALKEKIEAYWRERGQNVMLSLHNVGFHPAIRAARYDVRSDMVNGMPRPLKGAKVTPPKAVVEDFVDLEDFANDDDIAFE
ncbi:hypothetical protein [Terricaulis sp.]|uniref:hypothetical protein n=1 Tax=Terricaulis sp. TaxID=2768686 RepID=UPI003782F22F